MKSRALSLATLALLVGVCGWTDAGMQSVMAQALDAGKPPAQIFSGTCSACHRSPRGLVRSVSPGALPGFMRQHYTTGNDMAGTMAAYVLGNGGTAAVAEPPVPKREPKQKARSDAPEIAARTPEPKEQSKAARQKAAKKGQPEPAGAVRDAPVTAEPEKPDLAKPELAKPDLAKPDLAKPDFAKPVMARPEPPATGPAKAEAASVDCKVEEAKPAAAQAADDGKPGNGMPAPATTPPRQPTALLTLPGFPPPIAEPEPEPVAATAAAGSFGCDPVAQTTTAAQGTDEASKEASKDAPKESPRESPKEQTPTIAEALKTEPLRPAAAPAPAPSLDIMQEEVHGPRPARTGQQKKRAP